MTKKINVYTHARTQTHTHMRVCRHTHTCAYADTHTHACTQTDTHTHTHTNRAVANYLSGDVVEVYTPQVVSRGVWLQGSECFLLPPQSETQHTCTYRYTHFCLLQYSVLYSYCTVTFHRLIQE